jgi:sigma-54 dependent transcriptional regulator, acetoin dehydrogenase operon transcriptional activator AcoR
MPMTHTVLPHPTPANRSESIASARRQWLNKPEPGAGNWFSPDLQRSWDRCLQRGWKPSDRVLCNPVTTSQVGLLLEQNQPLLHAAEPVIRSLARTMQHTGYFALLTDARGQVLDVHGPADHSHSQVAAIARVGVDLSEQAVGTTAIGTALAEQLPVWLHQGEHFFEDTTVFTCAGAPIVGPDRRCVGMLDLTGIHVKEQPALKFLVAQAASRIENALTLAHPHELLLRISWPGSVPGTEADGLVCVDGDGFITGCNRAAADMLTLTQTCLPRNLEDVFACKREVVFDAAREHRTPSHLPLWSGLLVQVVAQLGAHPSAATRSARTAGATATVALKDVETAMIRRAVDDAHGSVSQAARALGISRATLYRKLAKH